MTTNTKILPAPNDGQGRPKGAKNKSSRKSSPICEPHRYYVDDYRQIINASKAILSRQGKMNVLDVIKATKMQKLRVVGSRADKEYIKQRRLSPRDQIKCIPREARWLRDPQDGGLVKLQVALGNL